MSPDFELDFLSLTWTHPDTGVLILDEDMPRELKPWAPRENGTWYTHSDRPIRQATLPERLYARLLAWKRRKAYRSLAHTIIARKRARQAT